MEDLAGPFIAAVLSASVVSTLITEFARPLRDRSERRQRSLLARQDQHRMARDTLLPQLVAVIAFVSERQKDAAENDGLLVAYHPGIDDRVTDWPEAMAELRRMGLLHPSPEVRQGVGAVNEEIQNWWVEPEENPSVETCEKWLSELRRIVETMHTVPAK